MKKQLLFIVLVGFISIKSFSQSPVLPATDSKEYEQLKSKGQIPALPFASTGNFSPTFDDLKRSGMTHKMPISGCGCYITPDATYTLAMAPNDDGSTGLLAIPFNFCLYGTNYTTLYINNNGNVSFGTSYGTFSSSPFPDPSYIMVAPFWGDVDTRGTGTVKYKTTATAMYINWEAVGYYSSMTDKVNTFQLIITDGTDPILPPGNNIAFCYGDMQWTTGAASSGVGGFGGVPSTVGVNKGDGVNYIQIGRFDQAGAAYDGGYGANDGVSWLDYQSFYFNSCSGNNIAPIASISPPLLSGGGGCDTLKLCATDDTLIVSALFLSPEIGQTTTISVNTYGIPGFSLLSNTSGNSATAQVQIIASVANAGMNIITFTATDDGVPAQTTTVNLNIFIDTTGFAAFNPIITGVLDFCEGGSTVLSVTPTTYDAYIWNNGSTGFSISTDSSGQYWCTARENGCFKTVLVEVVEHPDPTPVIIGNLFTCFTNTTDLTVDSTGLYSTYLWSNSSTNDSILVLNGTYTVTVTDSFGCVGTSPPVTVLNANPTVAITGLAPFCPGDDITLTAVPSIPSGAIYSWSTSSTSSTTNVTTAGDVIVTVTYSNGCNTADTVSVTQFSSPVANYSSNPAGVSNPGTPVSFTDLSTTATGTIITWVWYFGDSTSVGSFAQNPIHTYGQDGTYPVVLAVQNSNGCWDTISLNYEIVSQIQIPNVFTPNGDKDNEFLEFKNLDFYPGTALTVFNRWGNKIFENSDYKNNWNGGGQVDGVYYFILENEKFEKPVAGFIQILR
ncbi:MAG TPA: nidogen-like domain-containing protein [Bacteroidia bacterium]|jgi:gliding motility-associated-like protein